LGLFCGPLKTTHLLPDVQPLAPALPKLSKAVTSTLNGTPAVSGATGFRFVTVKYSRAAGTTANVLLVLVPATFGVDPSSAFNWRPVSALYPFTPFQVATPATAATTPFVPP